MNAKRERRMLMVILPLILLLCFLLLHLHTFYCYDIINAAETENQTGQWELNQQKSAPCDQGLKTEKLRDLPTVFKNSANMETNTRQLLTGLFLALFLIHLMLFLIFDFCKSNLIFAVVCLMWFLRMSLIGTKAFGSISFNLPCLLALGNETIALPAAYILLLVLVHQMFPKIVHKGVWLGAAAVSVCFPMVCIISDTLWMPHMLLLSYELYTAGAVCLCVRFGMMLPQLIRERQLRIEHTITFAAVAVFIFAAVYDALYYMDLYQLDISCSLMEASMLVFAFFQIAFNFYSTLREVTAARQWGKRIQDEKAMLEEVGQLKNKFYTNLSHEMKTPLTVITANAQLAMQNIKSGTVDRETMIDLNAISAEAKRLSKMVEKLAGLKTLQDPGDEQEPLDLELLIHGTMRMYQSLFDRRGNSLTVNVEQGIAPVAISADQLIQLLVNLLDNANRYTRNGVISVHAESLKNGVRISVADNGKGIEEDLLPHVFDRFSRGSEEGTGLGLSICKAIIEEHGGEIGVQSKLGKGTLVWFFLPIKEEIRDERDRCNLTGGG